jgi:photosystem II stability/assembly factor-like uncharacterized protein
MTRHALFVATVGEGVFKSDDHGESFRRACDGMAFVECYVRALVVDPADPATLYLGNECGVWVSRDRAENWSCLLPLDGASVWSLHVRGRRIVAGTCPSRLFLSDDGGSTWSEANATMVRDCPRIRHTRVTCVTADPDDPDRLWAGVEIDGLHHSADGGRSWRPRSGEGLTSRDIHAVAVMPGGRMLVTTNNDLNGSDDGQTWRAANMDAVLPWKYTRSLARLGGEVVLLGGGDRPPGWQGAIARSTDAGRTWSRVLPGLANSTVWNFATHPADGKLVYASSVSGEVYRSTDAGLTWGKLLAEFGEIRGLAWSPV